RFPGPGFSGLENSSMKIVGNYVGTDATGTASSTWDASNASREREERYGEQLSRRPDARGRRRHARCGWTFCPNAAVFRVTRPRGVRAGRRPTIWPGSWRSPDIGHHSRPEEQRPQRASIGLGRVLLVDELAISLRSPLPELRAGSSRE